MASSRNRTTGREGKQAAAICVAWLLCLAAAAASPVADSVGSSSVAAAGSFRLPGSGIREEAAMVLVGTALIGLASAVRRVG